MIYDVNLRATLLPLLLWSANALPSSGPLSEESQQILKEKYTQIQATEATIDYSFFDGCRYLFLDVGSNIGLHMRFLFEGEEKYPKQQFSKRIFDRYYPADRATRNDTCAFGFEPNPLHSQHLKKLEAKFRASSIRASWYHGGVAAKDGHLTFYHKLLQDEVDNEE